MDHATAIAIAKTIAKGLDLEPGTYPIDATVTLRVTGAVQRQKDVEYIPTTSIPLKATLALVLKRAGFQRERAIELLVGAMTEALKAEKNGADVIGDADLIAEAEKMVRERITEKLPKKKRKGATKVTAVVTEVTPATETVETT